MAHAPKEAEKEVPGVGVGGAQSVKCLTLDFCSGHDLIVRGFEPRVGLCADNTKVAWDSHSPSLSLPLSCPFFLSPFLSLSLKINAL